VPRKAALFVAPLHFDQEMDHEAVAGVCAGALADFDVLDMAAILVARFRIIQDPRVNRLILDFREHWTKAFGKDGNGAAAAMLEYDEVRVGKFGNGLKSQQAYPRIQYEIIPEFPDA
jgi:hypothetical protein